MVSPPVTLDAAEFRLLAAARVVADVQHAGEREPTRAEDQELLDAIAQYGDAAQRGAGGRADVCGDEHAERSRPSGTRCAAGRNHGARAPRRETNAMSKGKTKGKKSAATESKKGKASKGKKGKAEQLKIPGTGRVDAIEAIETQAEAYVTARDARMENQAEEEAEQEKLTALLKEHKLTEYVYEDGEGTKRRAYIPAEARAKVQKVKAAKATSAADVE